MAKVQPIQFPLNLGIVDTLIVKAIQMNMESNFCLVGFELSQSNVETALPDGSIMITNKTITGGSIKMDGEDYQNWGSDNDYVVQWVANKLGVVLI